MTPTIPRGTRIAQARIRAPRADAATCASRCAAIMPSLDLEPAGMVPQSILCIRSLADPLPGGIDGRSRYAETRPLAWEAAMRTAVAGLLQRAARPVAGPVPPDAEAVLFADEAELLACAARDACAGSLAAGWWWRHLLPGASFDRVVTAWARVPAYIPAAFESLVAMGAAVEWVSRLTPARAAMLLDTTLRTHALVPLADAVDAGWKSGAAENSRERKRGAPGPDSLPPLGARSPAPLVATAPPWRHVVPLAWEQAPIHLEGRTFAAMCIVLRRAAWLARSPSFAAGVEQHLARMGRPSQDSDRTARESAHSKDSVRPFREPVRTVTADSPDPTRGIGSARATPPPPETPLRSRPTPADSEDPPTIVPAGGPAEARPHLRETPVLGRRIDHPSGPAEVIRPGPPVPVSAPVPPTAPAPAVPDAEAAAGVESAMAGSFFLINVALDLGLYSHGIVFCDEIDIGIWRFIEIATVHLLREVDDTDRLWHLLRRLANQPDDDDTAVPDRKTTRRERRLLKRVDEHIAAILDIDDEAGRVLIQRPGWITRSPAHLDVHFALDRHPFAIRQARLDRNPGWLPSAGVHVAFHFN